MEQILKESFAFNLVLQLNFKKKKKVRKHKRGKSGKRFPFEPGGMEPRLGELGKSSGWEDQVADDQHWKAESGAKYNQQLS